MTVPGRITDPERVVLEQPKLIIPNRDIPKYGRDFVFNVFRFYFDRPYLEVGYGPRYGHFQWGELFRRKKRNRIPLDY